MTLTSYAQNFEDVLLWRSLGDVSDGFYVDVGAQHPRIDSVSLMFHEHGWHGIHVEPSPAYVALLRAQRPGDEVIGAALGAGRGEAVFHEIEGTGLSTLAPAAMDLARARGFAVVDRTVPTLPLDDVLASVDRPIHWLKIDVEGYEKCVIEGWTNAVRPWVVVIESILPGGRTEAFQDWEADILLKGYDFVWFDGLNRFYVHNDHDDLKVHFNTPPNVFDAVALSGEATSAFGSQFRARVAQLENALAACERRVVEQDAQAEQATGEYAQQVAEQVFDPAVWWYD